MNRSMKSRTLRGNLRDGSLMNETFRTEPRHVRTHLRGRHMRMSSDMNNDDIVISGT